MCSLAEAKCWVLVLTFVVIIMKHCGMTDPYQGPIERRLGQRHWRASENKSSDFYTLYTGFFQSVHPWNPIDTKDVSECWLSLKEIQLRLIKVLNHRFYLAQQLLQKKDLWWGQMENTYFLLLQLFHDQFVKRLFLTITSLIIQFHVDMA